MSAAEVEAKYVPRIEGRRPVQVYVFAIDDADAGMIQAYLVKDFPEYARLVQADSEWVGIDFFLGESAFRGKGLAPRVVEAFVSEVISRSGHSTCCSSPDATNERSIRTLLRAGFRHVGCITFDSGAVESLMVRQVNAAA